jgi:hypothetical protein
MKYKTALQILLGIFYIALTFGIFGPMLLSAKSSVTVGLGILVVFVVPVFVSIFIYNYFSKK